MNLFLLLDASVVPEAPCFYISDSRPSGDSVRAINRVILMLRVGELLRTRVSCLDLSF